MIFATQVKLCFHVNLKNLFKAHCEYSFLFLQASFEDDARIAFLTLLEYEPNEVREKIAEKTGSKPANAQAHEQGKYILMIFVFLALKILIFS